MQNTSNQICPVCIENYDAGEHTPLRLDCGHAICRYCFRTSHRLESRALCGRCSLATFSNHEVEDSTITSLVASLDVKCSQCNRSVATSYCTQHDKAHCARCSPARDCRMTNIYDEDFSLRHYLYSRILIFKSNLVKQLENSPLKRDIARIVQLTNQERLLLLKDLMAVETKIQCFLCSELAVAFDQSSLTICCAVHRQMYPGALQLWTQNREELIQQLKNYVRLFLRTVTNSFFDPDSAMMAKVLNPVKSSSTVYDIANSLFILNKLKRENMNFRQSGRIQCPMCYRVDLFQQVQMARLPCRGAIHLICLACYTENRNSLVCPFDGEAVPISAVVTFHLHY